MSMMIVSNKRLIDANITLYSMWESGFYVSSHSTTA